MNLLLYYFVRTFIVLLQMLPLNCVARIGRFFGGLFYCLDARHRRVARRNLTMCFGAEKSPAEIRALALESFKRIGENFVCPIKLVSVPPGQLWERLTLVGGEKLHAHNKKDPAPSIILAIGHFGCFELFAELNRPLPTHQPATSYRAIRNPAANRLLLSLRNRTGCLYFERRTEGAALRAALRSKRLLLGLLADQNAGEHGLRLPFLGHDCSTSKAPAVFALRFNTPLHVGICYRIGLGHWTIDIGDEIPTHENGRPRAPAAIMLDVNRAFETAVRRDPANWFWVHNRWKQFQTETHANQPATAEEDQEA